MTATAFRKPPVHHIGVLGWLRANLFSGIANSILTLLIVALLVWTIPPLLNWAFISAVMGSLTSRSFDL